MSASPWEPKSRRIRTPDQAVAELKTWSTKGSTTAFVRREFDRGDYWVVVGPLLARIPTTQDPSILGETGIRRRLEEHDAGILEAPLEPLAVNAFNDLIERVVEATNRTMGEPVLCLRFTLEDVQAKTCLGQWNSKEVKWTGITTVDDWRILNWNTRSGPVSPVGNIAVNPRLLATALRGAGKNKTVGIGIAVNAKNQKTVLRVVHESGREYFIMALQPMNAK